MKNGTMAASAQSSTSGERKSNRLWIRRRDLVFLSAGVLAASSASHFFYFTNPYLTANHSETPQKNRFSQQSEPLPSLLSLSNLANSNLPTSCPKGLVPVKDSHYSPQPSVLDPSRKIPSIVHITAKSRCLTPGLKKNVDSWRFENYSLIFHDDEAVYSLLKRPNALFPHLRNVVDCITQKAALADIWRYLILWEYGGIYTDVDSSPNKFDGGTLRPEDDAFFVVEKLGIMSQYFMAASPHHPLMYFSLQEALSEIIKSKDVGKNRAPFTTGPHATKMAFIHFMKSAGQKSSGYVDAGHYLGLNNRSVTVVGNKTNANEYVIRSFEGKVDEYKKMNMTHFSKERKKTEISCYQRILDVYQQHSESTSDQNKNPTGGHKVTSRKK